MKKLYFSVSFTNQQNVPPSLRWIGEDKTTRFEGTETPALVGKKVSLENLFSELEKDGLFIQSGFAQKRMRLNKEKKIAGKNFKEQIFFTMIKFEFGSERKNPVEESLLKSSFLKIFQDAFWDVRIFSHNDDVTIACTTRVQRFEGNDRLKPVRVWEKDFFGERVGDKPKLIEPEHLLSYSDGELILSKYE